MVTRGLVRFAVHLTILAAIATPGLTAQTISLYGTYSPTHITNAATGGFGTTTTTGYWSADFGGGVTYSPVHVGPLWLGADFRGSKSGQTQAAETLMAGVKLGINSADVPMKAYIQASGGYIGSRAILTNAAVGIAGTAPNTGFWGYEILGGVDQKIVPHVAYRLIEIAGGQGYYRGGAISHTPNISIFSVSTGVVVSF